MSEKKIDKKALILSSMVCLIPVLAGIILYAKLPDTIATHWDATGAVNGTSSKFIGIIVYPGILLAINLLIQPITKTQQSYMLGIRLPWTLHSEDNWEKTHRVAGYVWVICGFCMIIASLLPYRRITFPVLVACMVLIPTVYSCFYYKKNEGGTK